MGNVFGQYQGVDHPRQMLTLICDAHDSIFCLTPHGLISFSLGPTLSSDTLEIHQYGSDEHGALDVLAQVMRERLIYAIHNCREIDTDFSTRDFRARGDPVRKTYGLWSETNVLDQL
jgi:hypothetical protein